MDKTLQETLYTRSNVMADRLEQLHRSDAPLETRELAGEATTLIRYMRDVIERKSSEIANLKGDNLRLTTEANSYWDQLKKERADVKKEDDQD